jgi:hypothetical protein
LTADDPSTQDGPAPTKGGAAPFERPVDDSQGPIEGPVAQRREKARSRIAYVLLGTLIAQLAFFGFTVFGSEETWSRAQEYVQITLGGTLALVGSVAGFYYGSSGR